MKLIKMNERILELNAQADKYAWEKIGKKYDESRSLNWEWEDTKMAKFAELIIRECADFVAAGEFGDPGTAKQLMECFGVKEEGK